MGLMSLFGKGPLSDKKIAKITKLATNSYAQPDVRMREMQKLLDDASDAALRGLCKRFAANASGAIADEDEKKWLEEALVDVGEAAIEPLKDYIREEKQLSYALRAFKRLVGDDEAIRYFIEVMDHYGPDDYRGVEAKLQLVLQLEEGIAEPRVLPALSPFVLDHSDEVRWAVMDAIEAAADQKLVTDALMPGICARLGELVFEDDGGPRIQRRAAELLCRREWQIPGDKAELPTLLEEDYFLDKKRFVRRRIKRG